MNQSRRYPIPVCEVHGVKMKFTGKENGNYIYECPECLYDSKDFYEYENEYGSRGMDQGMINNILRD